MSSSSAAVRLAWPALCGSRSSSISTTPRILIRSSAKKIFTCWKRPARSASTVSPARCSIRAPCANCFPDSRKKRRIDAEVTKEAVYFLTEKGKFKFPITPPPLRDHGNYVISLNRFVKWLGGKVEETGITIFTGFAGSELLFDGEDGDRVTGVRTDDKGVDKQNQPKSNFEPGYDLQAKIVILAEGHARLADQATHRSVSISTEIATRRPTARA